MEINITKEALNVKKVICEKKEIINIQGDMIVPDSKPDILNTINTSGNVCIYKKEVMEEKIRLAVFGQKRLSREGGIEIVVKELCTRMAQKGCDVTCYNRAGHHVSGAEYDDAGKTEYEGIRQKSVPTIERRGLAAVSSSAFAALYSAFGKYDVVHIHAEGPAFFAWLPKMFGKRVVVTVHGECEIIWTTREKPDFMRVYAA